MNGDSDSPKSNQRNAMKSRLTVQRKMIFAAFSCVLFFAICEVCCRVYESLKPEKTDLAFMSSPISIMRSHPYLAYETNPDYPQHNNLGFRGSIDLSQNYSGLRIACIGGSTTYGTRVAEPDCYPRVLEKVLQGRYQGLPLEVINAGTAGYASHNLIGQLAFKVIPLRPDVLVIDVGHNDLWNLSQFSGALPDNTHAQRAWQSSHRAPGWWRNSAFLNKLAWHLGHPPEPPPHIHDVCWHAPSGSPEHNLKTAGLSTLRNNLLSLVAVARAHKCYPCFCVQPSDFRHQGGDPILNTGMQQAAELIVQFGVQEKVLVIDLRPTMNDEPSFFADYLHLNVEGEKKRAEVICDALEGDQRWKEIVAAISKP